MALFLELVREDSASECGWSCVNGPTISCSYGDWFDFNRIIDESVPGMRNLITLGKDGICFDKQQIAWELEEVKTCDFLETLKSKDFYDRSDVRHFKFLYENYLVLLEEAVRKGCLVRWA